MRASKHAASKVEESAPPEPDFYDDAISNDEEAPAPSDRAPLAPHARLCLACGGDGDAAEGCAHAEIAELEFPSRVIEAAVARLHRAASEQRAAERALRGLVLSEVSRGRGTLTTKPAPEPWKPEPCPRCLLHDAEAAAALAGAKPKRRSGAAVVQQALLFGVKPT